MKTKQDTQIQKRVAAKEARFGDKLDNLKEMRKALVTSKKALAMQREYVRNQKEDLFVEVILLVSGGTLPKSCLRVNETVLSEILGDLPVRGVRIKKESHQ